MLAELLSGNLDYTTTGLIDATHVRWFTRRSITELLERCGFLVTEIHRTLDPNALVAEYASRCTVKATGGPYNNRYIGVLHFKDGKVAGWKEFHNPEIATTALTSG